MGIFSPEQADDRYHLLFTVESYSLLYNALREYEQTVTRGSILFGDITVPALSYTQ